MNILKVFKRKKLLLIIILILVNPILQSLVFPYYNDFYNRLLISSTSLITIIFNLSIILLFTYELINLENNYAYTLRQKSLKDIIYRTIKLIIKVIISIYLITTLLNITGSFLGRSNNIMKNIYEIYNIKITSYLVYYYIKQVFIYILLSINIYFINLLFKETKLRYLFMFLLIGISFIFLKPIICSSYFIEILISIIYIILLLISMIILYKVINNPLKKSYNFLVISYLFKTKFSKLFIIYLLFYSILYYLNMNYKNSIGFFDLIGYYFLDGNYLGLIWTLFQVYLIIYFYTTYLFYEEDNASEYIILRESYKKFFINKVLFIDIIIIIFRIFIFLISDITKVSLLFILKYIFYDIVLFNILIIIIGISYYYLRRR